MYDIPHGVCNAVMLPTIMEYNLQYCKERYAQIATVIGIEWRNSEIGAHKAVEAVKKMAQDVELPDFSSFGINPGDFEEIAINSAENGSNASNARPMSPKDYEDILNKLYISW
jgi:alcohol dehydrogenase